MYFNMSFKVTEDREGFIIFYVMKYRKILIKYNAYISQPWKYKKNLWVGL